MYNHNFLNPIRHTQSSVFSNIGVPVSARKVTANNPKKESNLINKRIDNIKRQQQSLTSLLQEKEREEIETLAKIEKARKQRENEQLEIVQKQISALRDKLKQKEELEKKIRDIYDSHRETSLTESLRNIDQSKKEINKYLTENENEFQKLESNKIILNREKEKQKIIKDYENERQRMTYDKIKKDNELKIRQREQETEQELANLKLRYIQENLSTLKKDIINSERHACLLKGNYKQAEEISKIEIELEENKNAELTETIKNNNKNIISAMANDQDIVNVNNAEKKGLEKLQMNRNLNEEISDMRDMVSDFNSDNKDILIDKLNNLNRLVSNKKTQPKVNINEKINQLPEPNVLSSMAILNMINDDGEDDPIIPEIMGKLNQVNNALGKNF